MRISLRSVLALLVPTLTAAAQTPDRAALATRIDSVVRDFMTVRGTPGIAIAVLRGSDTLSITSYGVANRETNQPVTTGTVLRIGSMTKQFTSALIMRQIERGKLSLDDDMSKYLPDVPLHGHHVTIRQLLNHTSGIHSYTSSKEWATHWAEDLTPKQIVDFVAADTFDFAPGTKYLYNNSGYVLLGMILDKVTGVRYPELVQRELFTPLGLKQTSYCPSRPTDPSFASGYQPGPNPAPAPYLSMTQPYSAGSICSTARDFVKWQRLLTSGHVVSAKSYAMMTTPDTLNDGTKLTYGFGLERTQVGTHASITHGGSVHGFTSAGMAFPDDSLNVVVLTNSAGGAGPLAVNIARVVFGMPTIPMPRPLIGVPLADSTRDRLLGTYDLALPNGTTLPIAIGFEQGRLFAAPTGQRAFPIVHLGNLRFGTPVDPGIIITFVEENGKVASIRLEQGGATMLGPRRP